MTLNGVMTSDARYLCGSRVSCSVLFSDLYDPDADDFRNLMVLPSSGNIYDTVI